MLLMNYLLLANWLEQKHQGQKTRDAAKPATIPMSATERAEVNTRLQKLRDDPKTFSNWIGRKGMLGTLRIVLFGPTKAEMAEAKKHWDYEAGLTSSSATAQASCNASAATSGGL